MLKPISQESSAHRFHVLAVILSLLLVLSVPTFLVACGSQPTTPTPQTPSAVAVELQIFAANSLEKALPEVQAIYTQQNSNVTFADTQFKGSGDLVSQLQGGASADILITASASTMDNADSNGSIDASTRVNMFNNDLIIVKPKGSSTKIDSLAAVNAPEFSRVAIGDPDAVPAGSYANQSLSTVGLYSDSSGKGGEYLEGFGDKVVVQSSVGNVAKTVSTGDCQLGFVYTSDLYRYDGIESAFTVPADTHKAIVYPGAVVKTSKQATEAAKFLDFCLNDPEALKVWSEYGFEVAK
ncbi:MAG: molybdate ABC transporter substrate-binding protein [Coriobacteriales bacterium]|jgi:molybdate transport system substrate-binding protein|nr:molybdate ABC transporter substrate-binding protein [Coriobacteriales bacterium]